MASKGVAHREILKVKGRKARQFNDLLAVEEPLEIRLETGPGIYQNLTVTMRTPGHDEELAVGFLFTEGLIEEPKQIQGFRRVKTRHSEAEENVLAVLLEEGAEDLLKKVKRNFLTISACGVCGKTSIESVQTSSRYEIGEGTPVLDAALLYELPGRISSHQSVFECTGGLHAAALFTPGGELQILREDIGRHNALDKVIGAAFLQGRLPLSDHILLVSGRAGFELVQKAIMAGIPMMAAVGAPSSLAVQLAAEAGMTLVGFLRNGQFNVYCGAERLKT